MDSPPPDPAAAPTAPASSGWRRLAYRLLRNAILIYLGVCLVLWFLQDKVIFPGAASQGQRYAIVHPSPAYELIELRTASGQRTFAVFMPAADQARSVLPDAAQRPTLIHFYGNGEHLAHALSIANYFRTHGVNVLCVEYLGYGMAVGKPSEQAMYDVADAAYEYLLTRDDIDPGKIVPTGTSIGCAAAIDLASRRPVAAIVCFSPFTSLPAMGREVMPWLPTGLLLRYRFDNAAKLANFHGPVFIAHGRDDTIVPFHMSEELARIIPGPVTFVALDGTGHNNIFQLGAVQLREKLVDFLDRINATTSR